MKNYANYKIIDELYLNMKNFFYKVMVAQIAIKNIISKIKKQDY